ncbi:MAG: zinc-binding dehydrogenase [Anaerolineae bacterium]
MRAAVFYEHGGLDKLSIADVPTPTPGPDDVLVRVKAVALNHLDLFVREGIPGLKLTMPHIGGSDIAGVVESVGANVAGLAAGQRVLINPSLWCGKCEACIRGDHSLCDTFGILGEHSPGGLAEFISVPARNVLPIPDSLSFVEAAAVPLVYQTAWRALMTQAALRAGETVLILGASGGGASAAIQIAKLAGAYIYAVTSSEQKAAAARALGADETIDRTTSDFSREIWGRTKRRGVDVVLENTGAATWKGSLRAVRKGGRIVTYGATTGPMGETDIRVIFWKQPFIIGSTMASQSEFNAVMNLVFQGRLKPVIDRVMPLDDVVEAQRSLAAGEQFGKIVLTVD